MRNNITKQKWRLWLGDREPTERLGFHYIGKFKVSILNVFSLLLNFGWFY